MYVHTAQEGKSQHWGSPGEGACPFHLPPTITDAHKLGLGCQCPFITSPGLYSVLNTKISQEYSPVPSKQIPYHL